MSDPPSLAALPPVQSDEDLATFLRQYEIEAGGALILAMRDGTATKAQRAAVAQRILDITHGRPGQARQLTVADLAKMTEEERNALQVGLLKLYNRLPPVLEQLFAEMLRLATGQPEPPLPPWVPKWPDGTTGKRRWKAHDPGAAGDESAPERPRLQRGDGAPSTVAIRNPASAPHKREKPALTDDPSPTLPPISEARARPPVPYMIERYNGNRPPRQLVHEVMPTNDMSHALAMSRLSTRQW